MKVEYRRMPCGLKQRVEVSDYDHGTFTHIDKQGPGYCNHSYHVGTMFFPSEGALIGVRCEEHTSISPMEKGHPWRRVRIIDSDAMTRTEGKEGWEYVDDPRGD